LATEQNSFKMAMEYRQTFADAHSKPISCIAYHPIRKEFFTGSEGTFKSSKLPKIALSKFGN
jgi:hypothetical protein